MQERKKRLTTSDIFQEKLDCQLHDVVGLVIVQNLSVRL